MLVRGQSTRMRGALLRAPEGQLDDGAGVVVQPALQVSGHLGVVGGAGATVGALAVAAQAEVVGPWHRADLLRHGNAARDARRARLRLAKKNEEGRRCCMRASVARAPGDGLLGTPLSAAVCRRSYLAYCSQATRCGLRGSVSRRQRRKKGSPEEERRAAQQFADGMISCCSQATEALERCEARRMHTG